MITMSDTPCVFSFCTEIVFLAWFVTEKVTLEWGKKAIASFNNACFSVTAFAVVGLWILVLMLYQRLDTSDHANIL